MSTLLALICTILLIIICVYIIGIIACVDKLSNREYSKTYNALLSGDYVNNTTFSFNSSIVVFAKPNDIYNQKPIVFYRDDRAIKLLNGGYIFGGIFNYLHISDMYWGYKLHKWFDENDPDIVNRRNNKLKELGI